MDRINRLCDHVGSPAQSKPFIRQFVILTPDLAGTSREMENLLKVPVAYKDPEISFFEAEHNLYVVGDTILEVIAPKDLGNAKATMVQRIGARGGSSTGYMLMFQTPKLDKEALQIKGFKVVFDVDADDMKEVHLHPKGTAKVICAMSQPNPPQSWRWCGPSWIDKVSGSQQVAKRFIGAVIETSNIASTAQEFQTLLGIPFSKADSCFYLGNDQRLVLHQANHERGDGLLGFLVEATDPCDVGRRHILSHACFIDFV